MKHLTRDELEAGLAHVQGSPSDGGRLEMLARRPRTNDREILDAGVLDLEAGLVGDKWRDSTHGRDPAEHRDMQITVMNARAAALVAGSRERGAMAGTSCTSISTWATRTCRRARACNSAKP